MLQCQQAGVEVDANNNSLGLHGDVCELSEEMLKQNLASILSQLKPDKSHPSLQRLLAFMLPEFQQVATEEVCSVKKHEGFCKEIRLSMAAVLKAETRPMSFWCAYQFNAALNKVLLEEGSCRDKTNGRKLFVLLQLYHSYYQLRYSHKIQFQKALGDLDRALKFSKFLFEGHTRLLQMMLSADETPEGILTQKCQVLDQMFLLLEALRNLNNIHSLHQREKIGSLSNLQSLVEQLFLSVVEALPEDMVQASGIQPECVDCVSVDTVSRQQAKARLKASVAKPWEEVNSPVSRSSMGSFSFWPMNSCRHSINGDVKRYSPVPSGRASSTG